MLYYDYPLELPTQPQPAVVLLTDFSANWQCALKRLGLPELMAQILGVEHAAILLNLAAFYAFHGNSDLTRLEYFARTQLGESLSPQVACDALAALTPAQQTAFCAQWAQRHVGGDLLLYRVPARTAESGPELAWYGVEPLNLSLLVSAQRALPLYYALDADVPHVVAQARALGLTGRITMVGAAIRPQLGISRAMKSWSCCRHRTCLGCI